jgi:hypothetical protein
LNKNSAAIPEKESEPENFKEIIQKEEEGYKIIYVICSFSSL